ncbi:MULTISPECIES: hypothetical protein [unclassified Vibrio]|uniref:hypothetical protein n=1 Tax=unclassified Vibrio TaxID=2614977 RepID=UPI0012A7E42B|nr:MULTISPECIES: hypothetical protein [unclassified Vibrio]MCM5509769.1 hypothetical protein [Vibrio sp. SCSIO 43169]QFT35970.1 hypothetical protein FIU99_05975 [Vibrio sp. THAF64]QGM33870.1 hypothetical protein GGC04_05985 [Vibrio sp. THAF191d]QGN69372.1 hypothetical protein GGC03_05990 [Vibrio sp. THAF191c]
MSTLQAIPTQHGIDILNSELKNTVTKYRLIGALTHDASSESLYSFYENTIETSYYDDNGVLTFILNLPIEQHFDEYLHQIHVLDSSNQSVIECSTPKVALPKGIGGMVTLKAAISGEAGQVIFKHSEFVTETELIELHLTKYTLKDIAQFFPYDPQRIYSVGETCYTKDQTTDELTYWQWYSNVESIAGKSPLLEANRHIGWSDNTKPFYWVPYTGDQVGMPFYWLDTSAPEWAVMEINVDLPVAVYWRLARRYPHLVSGNTINTGDIRAEFLRVLDQGRGVDANRVINSPQLDQMQGHKHTYGDPRMSYCSPGGLNAMGVNSENTHETGDLMSDGTNGNVRFGSETRSRNVARPMAIAI